MERDQFAQFLDQFTRLVDTMGRIESRLAKMERSNSGSNGFPLGRLTAASTASTSSSSPLAGLPSLSDVPVMPVLPPLLDVLEDVQIEGAEVLPEVQQSLEQISGTLKSVQGASGSMAPAPNKVPDVKTAMDSTSADITQTLDKL
jgi:hypothetical protein